VKPVSGPLNADTIGAAGLPAEVERQLAAAAEESEALGRELLRCYEQLSLVFEITEHIATLEDPDRIQESLLRRFGTMLSAGAVFLERGGVCTLVPPLDTLTAPPAADAAAVHAALGRDIEHVRRTKRTIVPNLSPQTRDQLNGAHVLLGALQQFHADPGVVIALRGPADTPFDSGDQLAAESVLGYGGHILSNVLMVRHLQQTAVETVRALANAIDAKDNYTHGHSERVGWLSRFVGEALGLDARQLQVLEWAGVLHDVGKIGIAENILNKPGRLTDAEFAEMKRHPRLSYEVLRPVASLMPVLDGVLYHHENHDGSGYPEGLRGEAIPLVARIIHVVDIFDALTSTRSYRAGFPVARALEILEQDAGRVTDPRITQVFIDAFRAYLRSQPADFARRFPHLVPASESADTGRGAPGAPRNAKQAAQGAGRSDGAGNGSAAPGEPQQLGLRAQPFSTPPRDPAVESVATRERAYPTGRCSGSAGPCDCPSGLEESHRA
jgi:HD-GYP domain-containing protein (c-di-GMP phosphodiesterase class II)